MKPTGAFATSGAIDHYRSMQQTRIAAVGVGAVGGVFTAHLSARHDVVACVRRPFDNYVIESPDLPFTGPANAVTSVDHLPWDEPADVVLVALKAQHTEGAAKWFKPLCGPDTLVVVMQNGIEGEQRLEPYANGATILAAVVYCGAELLAPGHVRHDSRAQLIVTNTEAGANLVKLCDGTPLKIDASDSYHEAAWLKLGINSVVNGLTALTGRPMEVLSDPGIAAIGQELLLECWTAGRAEGVDLNLDDVPKIIGQLPRAAGGRTSMLHDREAGRPTEHDAIYGAVLRRAEVHNIPVPTTQMVHDLVAASSPG